MVEFTERPSQYPPERRSFMSRVLNMIAPDRIAQLDEAPAQPIRMIPGGPAAAELVMLPVEWDGLDAAADAERASRQRDVRLAQVKADGINAVFVDGLIVGGREGAPLDCALQAQPGLARLERAMGEDMVFLGEYVAHDGFNATLSELRRRRGDGAFWLYDAVPFAAWRTGRPYTVPIETRLERLRAAFHAADTGLFVGMLDWWLLDAGEMRAKAHEVWAVGFEGLVSKRLGSPYIRGRSGDWRKVKERFSQPCSLVDVAMKDGRLHRVIVRPPHPAGAKPITLTGGWSDDAAARIISADRTCHSVAHLVAQVDFSLTTGIDRTVRSPKFKALLA